MSKLEKYTDEKVLQIYNSAIKYFCNGLYVKSDKHPCGWDYISFEDIDQDDEEYDVFNYIFSLADINDYIYDDHDFDGKTLKEILESIGDNWAFEISGINW